LWFPYLFIISRVSSKNYNYSQTSEVTNLFPSPSSALQLPVRSDSGNSTMHQNKTNVITSPELVAPQENYITPKTLGLYHFSLNSYYRFTDAPLFFLSPLTASASNSKILFYDLLHLALVFNMKVFK
jgi:hypothetical protein